MDDILNTCSSPILPFTAPGYVEGNARSKSGFLTTEVHGAEVVYDFATMERGVFKFTGIPLGKPGSPIGVSTAIENSSMDYHLDLQGFDSNYHVEEEYSGPGTSFSFGVGAPLGEYVSGGIGMVRTHSAAVEGTGTYSAGSVGWSPIQIFAVSLANADYTIKYEPVRYGYKGYVDHQDIEQIQTDIMSGVDSPWPTSSAINWFLRHTAATTVEDVWKKHEYYFRMRFGEPH